MQVNSDHHTVEVILRRQTEPPPETRARPLRIPTHRLKNPAVKKAYHDRLTALWEEIEYIEYANPEERYAEYHRITLQAAELIESTPASKNPEHKKLRKLRREQGMAHWKWKVLTQRGDPKAQKWHERKLTIAKEYTRRKRYYEDKNKDIKEIEHILANT